MVDEKISKRKCTKKRWCDLMERQVQPSSSAKVKGLSVFCTDKIDSKGVIHTRLWGVVSRNSKKDRGLLLNVCPWCRAPILWADNKKPNIISRS